MPDRTCDVTNIDRRCCLHVTKTKTYANENQSQLLRRKYANKSCRVPVRTLIEIQESLTSSTAFG